MLRLAYSQLKLCPECNCTLRVTKTGYLPKTFAVKVNRKSVNLDAKLSKVNKPELKLEILVLDKSTNEPIPGVALKIKSGNTNEVINSSTDKEGKLLVAGIKENLEIEVTASKTSRIESKRFLIVSKSISTVGKVAPAYLKEIIFIELVEKNIGIKLDRIYFEDDKYDLKYEAQIELDKLVKVLKDNPGLEIELGCHTDCRGTYQKNMNLSSKRAEALVSYMITKGVEQHRIIATGYGESSLKNDCICEGERQSNCSEEQHRINRRTEFKILKF